MTTRHLTYPLTRRETGDDGVHAVTITTSGVDRMDDIVVAGGARTANWEAAGRPILYAHRHDELPIGRGVGLTPRGDGIRMTFRFLEGDEFALRCQNAWRQGALGAASIGFVPVRTSPLPSGQGLRIDEWDLLEVSLTATPANPECVRTLKSLGLPTAAEGPDDEIIVLREAPTGGPTNSTPGWLTDARHLLASGMVSNEDPRYAPVRHAIEDIDAVVEALTAAALGRSLNDPLLSVRASALTRMIQAAVAPLEQQLRTGLRQRADDDDTPVLVLADSPDDLLTVEAGDLETLPDLIATSLRDGIGPVVKQELTKALNAARGRLDD